MPFSIRVTTAVFLSFLLLHDVIIYFKTNKQTNMKRLKCYAPEGYMKSISCFPCFRFTSFPSFHTGMKRSSRFATIFFLNRFCESFVNMPSARGENDRKGITHRRRHTHIHTDTDRPTDRHRQTDTDTHISLSLSLSLSLCLCLCLSLSLSLSLSVSLSLCLSLSLSLSLSIYIYIYIYMYTHRQTHTQAFT